VFFQCARQHCCSLLLLLARNPCRCRGHRGRPGQQAHLDQQDPKAHLAHKAPLEWQDLWGRKENQVNQAPLVQLVPKERSDQRAAEGKVALPALGAKLVLRAPWALPALKGSKAAQVKKARWDRQGRRVQLARRDRPARLDHLDRAVLRPKSLRHLLMVRLKSLLSSKKGSNFPSSQFLSRRGAYS
jgi:hypothetical protein